MCGIAGIATVGGVTPNPRSVRAMTDALRHRGPDGEGIHVAPGVGLGMRRLAVIDLVTGDQPMGTPDGRVHVVFNGEIYNYRELRSRLEARGVRFRTQSDTEVLPHLYAAHGASFLSMLNGMFAIALWDAAERTLLLARDRIGIKPLHYAIREDRLTFASELKSILAVEPDLDGLDPLGLHQLLSLEYTLTPRTLFRAARKVPAGGWVSFRDGRLREGRFWSLSDREPDPGMDVGHAVEAVRATVVEAVRRQLMSDVPLGAFLSGGIDSSILVAAMSEAASERPRTFSVGFGHSSYDELSYARLVARRFDTQHHEARLAPAFLDHLERVVEHLDQPIADFSVFPTLLVSETAREHVTVALGGDGGDELFYGYDTYEAQRAASRSVDLLPVGLRRALHRAAAVVPLSPSKRGWGNTLRRFLQGAALDPALGHLRWMIFLDPPLRRRVYTESFGREVEGRLEEALCEAMVHGARDRQHAWMASDLRIYLTENILPKVDLMSMAVSLEARVPYLDNDVIDLALAIPSSLKRRRGDRKWILKQAFRDVLPGPILARGKEGFSIPIKNWLTGAWNGRMHELLEDDSLYRDGRLSRAGVLGLMAEHEAGRHNHSHLLWALMLYQLWCDRFLRSRAPQAVRTP